MKFRVITMSSKAFCKYVLPHEAGFLINRSDTSYLNLLPALLSVPCFKARGTLSPTKRRSCLFLSQLPRKMSNQVRPERFCLKKGLRDALIDLPQKEIGHQMQANRLAQTIRWSGRIVHAICRNAI